MNGLEPKQKRQWMTIFHLVWSLLHCRTMATQALVAGGDTPRSGSIACREVCEYKDWFKRVKCDGRNLYTVPSSEGCEESTLLELQRNHIRNISADKMKGYGNVRTLDLSENEITEIQPGSFSSTKELMNILLNRNYLYDLKNATFMGTEKTLTRIYLSENNIARLNKGVFSDLEKLKSLYLNDNKIQNLPPYIFHGLNELQLLHLGRNRLSDIDVVTFQNLTKLKSINLSDNKLTSIPNGFFQSLDSFQEVDLSNNVIAELPSPDSVGIISIIQSLYLNNNSITSSSSIIPYLHLTQQILDISSNPFTCDCDFQAIQEWSLNNSQQNFLGDSVTCILHGTMYNICEPLNFTCEIPQTATQLSPDPMVDTLSETGTQHRDKHHLNIDVMISTPNNNLDKWKQNKDGGIELFLLIYCAVFLTIIIAPQISYFIVTHSSLLGRGSVKADKGGFVPALQEE